MTRDLKRITRGYELKSKSKLAKKYEKGIGLEHPKNFVN
jgi:hypothetical protein